MTSSDPSVQLNHTPGHIKHDGHNLTGFVIFLCSESIIFLAFFAGFSLFKLTSPEWLPAGVDGLEVKMPCLLYTSPSPRDISGSRMPSSA